MHVFPTGDAWYCGPALSLIINLGMDITQPYDTTLSSVSVKNLVNYNDGLPSLCGLKKKKENVNFDVEAYVAMHHHTLYVCVNCIYS